MNKNLRLATGVLFSINFVLFWSLPIMLQGLFWKHVVKGPATSIYNYFDQNASIRNFAVDYIYQNPIHADFFVTTIFILLNTSFSVGVMFYYQLQYGYLPWWLIVWYYFSWVGIGGRTMGGAYALAHKEGHNRNLYKKWIRESVGNVMENIVGIFFGNVPWNFTTSHIFIHHKLDGGMGDTFYQWDLDRSSLHDFMLYIYRIFLHMSGYSSLKFFDGHDHKAKKDLLMKGVISYWTACIVFLVITRSPSFVFWFYFQPFICMTYFLALLNFGFHGFIEFDENGVNIPCVNSTTIINGEDDYFGEDDHMAHHYAQNVYFKDLKAHQVTKVDEFKKYRASVFQKLSILEVSIFVLFGLFDKMSEHYVDYTGKMTKEEIVHMLTERSKTKETTYEKYEEYLDNPTLEKRKALMPDFKKSN